jgi:xylan 1,4-beta-xylosidase
MREYILAGAALIALCAAPAAAEPVATFSDMSYRAIDPPKAAPGNYRNPVLPGFHPDPAILRHGDDYYLVTSTFAWYPGLPIYHSRDLVNWKLIGHAIDRPGMLDFTGMNVVTDAVYAPAIEYHDGKFYIFNTCVRCRGNFYVTATDPAGPWSDPVWIDVGGIDPSLFIDDDGSTWLLNNDDPRGGSRYQGHRAIWIQRIDLSTGAMVGPRTQLVDGGVKPEDNPIWPEGPHIYKVDGWYYLSAAEGGTADGHAQTIYRSRSVTGPFEPGPINPNLTQRDLPRDRPDRVEATGHADFVELDDGSWWVTFLATRPFEGQSSLLGRETWLLPVTWKDGWPIILDQGKPVPLELKRPNLPAGEPANWDQWREDFRGPKLSGEWLQIRNPANVQWYALDRDEGELQVVAGTEAASTKGKPHFLGRRMRHPKAEWTTRLDFSPEKAGDLAGIMAFGSEAHFLVAGIEGGANGPVLAVRSRNGNGEPNGALVANTPLPAGIDDVELRLTITDGTAAIDWRPAGRGAWRSVAKNVDVEHMASIHTGLFTGVTVGPYAYSPN